jgi:hypothetical protein
MKQIISDVAHASEAFITERRAATGRSCGDCSLCCKLLPINTLGKPANKWCQHCLPGNKGGCAIYNNRPPVCRGFACQWLANPELGDEWRPTRAKMVAHFVEESSKPPFLRFAVDPGAPNKWRTEPYYTQIKIIARNGLNSVFGYYFQTYVDVGDKYFVILSNKDVELRSDKHYAVVPVDNDRWNVLFFDNADQASRLINGMNAFVRVAATMDEKTRLQAFMALTERQTS